MFRWLAIWYFHLLSDVTPISPRTCFIRFVIFYSLLSDPLTTTKRKKKAPKNSNLDAILFKAPWKKSAVYINNFFHAWYFTACLYFLLNYLIPAEYEVGDGEKGIMLTDAYIMVILRHGRLLYCKCLIFMNNCERYVI